MSRAKPKPYAPRIEKLEKRQMMSRDGGVAGSSVAARPDLDSFAWGLLERPDVAAEMHLSKLAGQLGGLSASAIAKNGLGVLLSRQLAQEPGYAARHGLAGLIHGTSGVISITAVELAGQRSASSTRSDLESFAWALLERPAVVAEMHLGKLAGQLGHTTAAAISDRGLGGVLAKTLAKEPGYAARHGLTALITPPSTSSNSQPNPASTLVAESPEIASPAAGSGVVSAETIHPNFNVPCWYQGGNCDDYASFFSVCAGCEITGNGALASGNALTGGPQGVKPYSTPALNSDIGLASGSYFQDHPLVAYTSQGATRSIDLQYSSLQASPYPIVQVALTTATGSDSIPITSITARLSVDGGTPSTPVTYSVSSLTDGATYIVALQFDATALATGVHNVQVSIAKNHSNGTTANESYGSTINVVNDSASPDGAGWSIGGLQSITTNSLSTSVLITAGSQGTEQYTYTGTGYAGPAVDPSTLVKNSGGTWTRTYTNGTVIQFDTNGRETSEADSNGNTTSYAYVTSGAAAGALSTITDPVGRVTTLSYNGSGKLSTVTDPAGRVTTVTIDSNGNLTGITDPDSASVAYGYSTPSNHRMTTEVSPNGFTATVTYDSFGRVASEALFGATGATGVSYAQSEGLLAAGGSGSLYLGSNTMGTVTDPLSHTVTLIFDSMYHPLKKIDGTSASTTIVLDSHGWPTAITDPLNRTTTYAYDSSGNVTGMSRPDGTSMSMIYGVNSQPTQITDYRGLITTFTLDSHGNVTRRTDPDSLHEDWTYNSAGQMLTDTDRNGHATSYAYDSYGELTTITHPGTSTPQVELAYNAAGDVTRITDELGHATTFTYDQAGRMLSMQNPVQAAASKATSYAYDADGNLTSVTDALGHTTSYAYDARDRLTTMTDAANQGTGQATVFGYNGMNLISITDPNGHTTTYSYDGDNREIGTTDALGHRTTWTYDADGELQTATDSNGNTTTSTYDQEGRLQTKTFPGTAANGSGTLIPVLTTYTYNADDQVTSVTDALGHATTYSYDNLGRQTSITDALNHTTSYGYDNAGNLATVTDPLSHTTSYAYDVRNLQVSVTEPAGGGTTTYTFDDASRLTSVTDPVNNVTSYGYDAANRRTTETDPLGHATTYAYDLADNMTQKTDRDGRVTSYAYDADNRETAEQWIPSGGGSAVYSMTMTYDYAGRLTQIQDNFSKYAYGYDNANRLTTIDDQGTTGLPQVTMTYGYDNVGNRTSLSDSQGGVVSYTYDARNELTTLTQSGTGVSAERVDMIYDAGGRMTTLTRYSDTAGTSVVAKTISAYDAANRLTTVTNLTSGGATISSYAYSLDAANRLTSLTRVWNGGASSDSAAYSYTTNNQLTSVTHTNFSFATESFGYDSNGNRNSTGYSTGTGNELSTDGIYNYTYDNNGNLITKTSIATGLELEYTWDYRNRLTEVQQVSGGVTTTLAQYTYDALNNPIEVVEGGATRCTLYDGQTPLLDFNGSGQVAARYLSVPGAIDDLLARQASSGVAWYLTDREGSVNDVISNSGSVIDHVDYGAFGTVLDESSPSMGDRFKYAGMEVDAATGNYYDRARYYDAAMGRFLDQDPLGFLAHDENLFRYTFNNPSNTTDASGEIVPILVIGGIAFVGILFSGGPANAPTIQPSPPGFPPRTDPIYPPGDTLIPTIVGGEIGGKLLGWGVGKVCGPIWKRLGGGGGKIGGAGPINPIKTELQSIYNQVNNSGLSASQKAELMNQLLNALAARTDGWSVSMTGKCADGGTFWMGRQGEGVIVGPDGGIYTGPLLPGSGNMNWGTAPPTPNYPTLRPR
jgi:RHS repeat-associated protein